AGLQKEQIELKREHSEEEALSFLAKQAKQREESIAAYQQANRDDLAQKEQEELVVIQSYLPAQLEETEVRALLQEIIDKVNAQSMKDMGKIMKAAMPQLKGRFPSKQIQPIVKELLG
ncbi:MAG: GatB/YqeY domain-containing protein, partial [Myxococcota bacterium]